MNKNDIRYVKTEKKLEDAFWKLLATVGVSKMNVRMLTEESGVNRSTFYIHFQDKYMLLEKIENDIYDEMAENVAAVMSKETSKIESLMPFMLHAAQYAADHKDRFSLIMSENGDPLFLEKYIMKMKKMLFPQNENLSQEKRYAMAAVIGIITGLFTEWMQSGCSESPEEYIKAVSSVAQSLNLFSLIEMIE